MRLPRTLRAAALGLLISPVHSALTVDFTDTNSIKQGAQQLASGLMQSYTGNQPGGIPGILPQPYYWWEAGAMFGAMVDYWYYTGDSQYNDAVTQALQFQVGQNADYMPQNQTKDEGNDDQSFWAMAALAAAEHKFPDPPGTDPSWISLAQAVFNTQAPRWDDTTCGGGLRWQIYPFNTGYNYKNTISNSCFFATAARLGRYTGNQTYFDWANKMWTWINDIGVMSTDYHFYDGTDSNINCSQVNHIEWTYNTGIALYGAAIMFNASTDPTVQGQWQTRIEGILKTATSPGLFFDNGVMTEVACEVNNNCDVDQQSFKGYLARWMAATVLVAPFTAQTILPLLKSSAQAAVATCTGGASGSACGLKWTTGSFDGSSGVGETMAALEIVQANLVGLVAGPVTADTGGTSKQNPNAGANAGASEPALVQITGSDRAGAGILTTIVLISMFGGSWWMAAK